MSINPRGRLRWPVIFLSAVCVLIAAVVAAPAAQAAGPRPLFQLPFPCGESWRLGTYPGHDDYDIDMTATTGTTNGRPILASFGGTVVRAGQDDPDLSKGGGYYVRIDHGNGWQTLYLHMIEYPPVRVGQVVAQGQQIGRVGSTGASSGPHLHYEQRRDGSKVESWFDGVPSGITTDGYPAGEPQSPAVTRISRNCGQPVQGVADGQSVHLRGDFTGDGRGDVGMLYNYGNARSALFVAASTGTGFGWPQMWWDSGVGNFEAERTKVVAGDFTGDGRADAGLLYNYGSGRSALFVAASTGSGFGWPQMWWDSGVGNFEWERVKLTVGDYNNDGRADAGLLYNYGNARSALFVAASTGTGFGWPQAWWDSGSGNFEWERVKLVSGDFTGDGRADGGLLYNYGNARSALFVATSTGTGFGWPQAWWDSGVGNFEWERVKLTVGDHTGDGRMDVGLLYNYDNSRSALFTAASTGGGFGWPQMWWDSGNGNFEWERVKLA
ncbi:M23 family metallopeptidase [Phytohabitans aurantiacus]|uniref:M23ase beta-sheet core domain-containing protein n=1 Tax=Phytohabitans aurantiacus TaxID=3016789 RepID=A0ABQ5R282_9ACTN|nr:M23 family metallopeptidase [Phytohabitans aurantiacus]GLH99981.1 hypothetical protein Pa4123_52570 [Phytohabitans aurantiacus]